MPVGLKSVQNVQIYIFTCMLHFVGSVSFYRKCVNIFTSMLILVDLSIHIDLYILKCASI